MCLANGTWSEKTDYSNCSMFEPILEVKNGDYSDVIYMVGYAVSLIALTIALFIFLKFRYCLFIYNFTLYKLFFILLLQMNITRSCISSIQYNLYPILIYRYNAKYNYFYQDANALIPSSPCSKINKKVSCCNLLNRVWPLS